MIVRWGTLKFDSDRRLVIRESGEPVHLTPKAFDLLHILVEQAPRVVPKDELHLRLWPDSFVSEATLAGLVKDLRRALCAADARSPRFIRTSHGIGYAFDGPLLRVTDLSRQLCWVVFGNRRIPLKPGENLIGRDPTSDVCLDVAEVSRRHARIVIGPSGTVLEDLGSKNGTAVPNGPVTGPVHLVDGEVIRIGPIALPYFARPLARRGDTTAIVPADRKWRADVASAVDSDT